MSDLLERLYAAKARVLAEEQQREPLEALLPRARTVARRTTARSGAALRGARGPAIVAEIKRASPTRRPDRTQLRRGRDRVIVRTRRRRCDQRADGERPLPRRPREPAGGARAQQPPDLAQRLSHDARIRSRSPQHMEPTPCC